MIKSLEWIEGGIRILDQTHLPHEEVYVECRDVSSIAEAIRSMRIRGAPAIGVAAAAAMALGAQTIQEQTFEAFSTKLSALGEDLAKARPTAVNLKWGIERMKQAALKSRDLPLPALKEALVAEAKAILEEDIRINQAIGAKGQVLIQDGSRILTHCNTGSLATAGYGTALGVIRSAKASGKRIEVLANETRPFLQGARLTAWELLKEGIPFSLITDSMAGSFMHRGMVDLVLVGADRIAANGDVANKIGTYTLAVLAKEHGIPFYVAAPLSTLDLTLQSGDEIPIEERSPEEVTHIGGRSIAPPGITAKNPAFDITPARYVTAMITERGIAYPPYKESLRRLVER
ncbi:MAG: S-methyl-5-thioribose-1-phosphate isomerase [candidate division NC10 bacterium]|nr:S-methyl-5-thioribose-1-phosphate isomerase [candidate division NC10 bacterium]